MANTVLSEHFFPVTVLEPDADRYDTDPATDVVNAAKYGAISFYLMEGAGGTGTVKIEVEECTAAAGTGNTAVAFKYRLASTHGTWGAITDSASTGYTTVAGANKMVEVIVDVDNLSSGSNYVRLQLTEVADSPVDAAVVAILGDPRYSEDVMPSPLT